MPRHPEGERAMTGAQRQARRRSRAAAREMHYFVALMTIVYSPPDGEAARRIAWKAIQEARQ